MAGDKLRAMHSMAKRPGLRVVNKFAGQTFQRSGDKQRAAHS
ncbi:hypothetical protein [Spirosoma pulveris]